MTQTFYFNFMIYKALPSLTFPYENVKKCSKCANNKDVFLYN